MAMAKKIQVRIYPDGRIEAVTKGIKGKKCTNYIGLIEKLVNAETVDSDYTEEYYETEEVIVEETVEAKITENR
jgi:hypothetical protein